MGRAERESGTAPTPGSWGDRLGTSPTAAVAFFAFGGLAMTGMAVWMGSIGYPAVGRGATSGPATNSLFVPPALMMAVICYSSAGWMAHHRRARFIWLGVRTEEDGVRTLVRLSAWSPLSLALIVSCIVAMLGVFAGVTTLPTTPEVVIGAHVSPLIAGVIGYVVGRIRDRATSRQLVIDHQLGTARLPCDPGHALPSVRLGAITGIDLDRRRWSRWLTGEDGKPAYMIDLVIRYRDDTGAELSARLATWAEHTPGIQDFAAWLRGKLGLPVDGPRGDGR